MQDDIRAAAAQYYDVNPTIPDDLAFYTARLPSADAAVLELGCGTGRVLLPLAAACGSIAGLERSPAMLARCLQKLQAAGIPLTKARAVLGDITHFALGRRFDLIIAPYRVFQLLETEAQVEGLFRCVRAHLAPGGTGILNVFHPQGGFERVRQEWERVPEVCVWEATVDGVRLRCDERGRSLQLGEGWHSSRHTVCFWNPLVLFQKETDARCYASATAYAMMTPACNACSARWKRPTH